MKFTQAGQVVVSVACEGLDSERARMRVSIRDTGVGISEDKVKLLFQKFSQVDGSATRRYGGTGLGLAISKQLVELMGGQIGVQSRPGKGSTFWFSLPLPLDTHPQAAPLPMAELAGLRVLIVDDNEVSRRALHEQVVQLGMQDGAVASGAGVLAAIACRAYRRPVVSFSASGSPDAGSGWSDGGARRPCPTRALRDIGIVMLTSAGGWNEIRQNDITARSTPAC